MERKQDALADSLPTSRDMSKGILDHPVPAKPQADGINLSEPRQVQQKNHLADPSPNCQPIEP